MNEASFEVEVSEADIDAFARLSGDMNRLHVDASYAAGTPYGRRVLHGAFSAGLLSRMAGMHLPGDQCLLQSLRLRFLMPITPPVRLKVAGVKTAETGDAGHVEVSITDAVSGLRYVEGSYDFTRQGAGTAATRATSGSASRPATGDAMILVTGASGGLGAALVRLLGDKAIAVPRQKSASGAFGDPAAWEKKLNGRRIEAIVHCAWPQPDNMQLTALKDAATAVDHHVAVPIGQAVELAQLLARHGSENAMLVLIGSTFAEPGRHGYRMPLYSLAKSTIPTLARILALELGANGRRCNAVVFDVLDGGMNKGMTAATRLSHADRAPGGQLGDPAEAAAQIAWLLSNASGLASGATITLAGAALP